MLGNTQCEATHSSLLDSRLTHLLLMMVCLFVKLTRSSESASHALIVTSHLHSPIDEIRYYGEFQLATRALSWKTNLINILYTYKNDFKVMTLKLI